MARRMGTAGCGILATVNAVYALTGQYMDVTARTRS